MGRYSSCTYFQSLYDAVENIFPAVDGDNARTLVREVILAPDDYEVEFNNSSYTQKQLRSKLAHQLVEETTDGSAEQTFFNVLENAAEIMKHMNDGYITTEDYQERKDFLDKISRHEFMLFAALALYKAAGEPDEKIFDELSLNVVRLREINDLIVKYTRDAVEIEVDRSEFERAKPIYRMLKSLQSLGYEYNFSPRERTGLGIDHEQDDDLNTEFFGYENWLKRLMLLQLRIEFDSTQNVSAAQEPVQNDNIPAQEEISAELLSKISALRGTMSQRRFDKEKFLMLEESNLSEPYKKGANS